MCFLLLRSLPTHSQNLPMACVTISWLFLFHGRKPFQTQHSLQRYAITHAHLSNTSSRLSAHIMCIFRRMWLVRGTGKNHSL